MNSNLILTLLPLVPIFVTAGLVKGVTGMGLPTVAMAILGAIMPPAAAAALLVVPSFVTNVWQLAAGPAMLRIVRRFGSMMLGIVLGTIAGSALLVRVDPVLSGLALGVVLVFYAGYALFAPALQVPARAEPWLSPLIGVATGLITGATGVFVMPAVPYLQAMPLEKEELVQALGLSFTVSTIALAIGLAVHDAFRPAQLELSALVTIPALAGMWVGQKIRARISPRRFRQCLLLFLLVLGLKLASRAVL